jgi:hypothetical protein
MFARGGKVTTPWQIMSCQPRGSYGIHIDDTGVKHDSFTNDTGVTGFLTEVRGKA